MFLHLIITDPAFNLNQASFDVISYNIDNYTNKNFKTEGSLVDNKYIMITVSGFSDIAHRQWIITMLSKLKRLSEILLAQK